MGKKSKSKDKGKARDKARKKERRKAERLAAAMAGAGAEPVDDASAVAEVTDIADARRRRTVDSMELAARLASISTVLQRHLSRADAGEGLTRARLSALALLVLGGPRTLGDLAAAEHVRPPTMTRLIHAMEADGLVTRRRNPDDARSVVIEATPRGVKQLETGRVRQIAPLAETISDLDRVERLQLEEATDLLGRVLRDFDLGPGRLGRVSAAGPPSPAQPIPRPRTDRVVWLALIVALVLLLQTGTPPRVAVLSAIVVGATLAYSLHWRVAGGAIVMLLLVGLALRIVPSTGFSDVLVVTEAASREILAGGNPYGHGFEESIPPGAPFAYGPLALLWYLPSLADPGRMEMLAAVVVLALLALRGRPLGLAIYAVTPAFVVAAGDGSNDTTAGLLILVALLAAVRLPLLGAALLAAAMAFKPYALAWLPGLIGFAGLAPLVVFLATSAVFWLPALIAWGPGSLLWSYREADALHGRPYYSLAYGLGSESDVPRAAWNALRVGAGVALAILNFVFVRSAAGLIIGGTLVFAATLYLGWWGTFAYLSAVAPIICWHLDDWLGLDGRVAWPGGSVRRVTDWADMSIPVRGSVMGSKGTAG